MIPLLAAVAAAGLVVPVAPTVPPLPRLAPAAVLARYAGALAALREPVAMSFEYALEQSGMRNGEQLHRVFRSGSDERDELLAVDGRKLDPPTVRIFHGRRNRYMLSVLAPRPDAYGFRLVGTRVVGRHLDYVFATTARGAVPFRITEVTIDGSAFVPVALAFRTADHGGHGTITFLHLGRYWVALAATANASYGQVASTEKIGFMHYRFPPSLPPSTFAVPRGAAPPEE